MDRAVPYTKGAHEVADGVWAYLQPDGGWGRSNAGLIASADGDTSLLVDTLFDLDLTADMLAALRQATPAAEPITTVVNTHANGDHCSGNALVAGAEIVASAASAADMAELPASVLAAFMRAAPDMGATGAFLLDIFGAFHFEGIELVAPTRTFTGQLDLRVGDRPVQLIEIGPAHTAGDVIVHVPATPERHRRA
jgi:glyoxylase-like metal-dependent hydrolase (beta-lactamase superfamily II)